MNRYEIEVLAPVGPAGRLTSDAYVTDAGYTCDHTGERLLIKLVNGADDKGRPVHAAQYGGGMRSITRLLKRGDSDEA